MSGFTGPRSAGPNVVPAFFMFALSVIVDALLGYRTPEQHCDCLKGIPWQALQAYREKTRGIMVCCSVACS